MTTEPTPTPTTTSHPRQKHLCQLDDCPHLRRQNILHIALLATLVPVVFVDSWLHGHYPKLQYFSSVTVALIFVAITLANVISISREFFGFGRHTPLPDERDQMIAVQAQAQLLHILTYWLLPVLAVGLSWFSITMQTMWALVAIWSILTFGPKILERRLRGQM